MARLEMDPAFAERSVNEGFSGGEKKRHEILQLELLQPKIAILDETDSGLDVDALRVVSEGVNRVREAGTTGTLLITHYTRILNYIKPDHVHVFAKGRIAESGGPELATRARGRGLRQVRRRRGRRRRRRTSPAAGHAGEPRPGRAAVRGRRGAVTARRRPPATGAGLRPRGAAARTSRSCPARCTATCRWSTSTARRPRRSRCRCSTRWTATTGGTTPTCTAASTPSARRRTRSTTAPAPRSRAFLGGPPRRGRVHQERHRGLQPGRLRDGQRRHRRGRRRRGSWSAPATRSSSPRWSTTPTSCRGSCCASGPARRCAGSASPTTAGSTSPTLDERDHRADQDGRVRAPVATSSAR